MSFLRMLPESFRYYRIEINQSKEQSITHRSIPKSRQQKEVPYIGTAQPQLVKI